MKKMIYTENDIKRWITIITPRLLFAKIPLDFKSYWDNIEVQSRTDFRKAEKNGLYVKRENIPPHKDIISIWNSFSEKQGRPINKNYNDIKFNWMKIEDKWPFDDYSIFDFNKPTHMAFYCCYNKEGICKAFLETITHNKITAVHGTLGHSDSYKFGIMKFIFLNVIKDYIEKHKINKLYYGDKDFLKNNRRHFIKQLLIKEHL